MNISSKITRKNFLRLSTMGMAGLGLAPLQSVMAKDPKKCEASNSAGTIQLDLIGKSI